jgi:hypothetical protein
MLLDLFIPPASNDREKRGLLCSIFGALESGGIKTLGWWILQAGVSFPFKDHVLQIVFLPDKVSLSCLPLITTQVGHCPKTQIINVKANYKRESSL